MARKTEDSPNQPTNPDATSASDTSSSSSTQNTNSAAAAADTQPAPAQDSNAQAGDTPVSGQQQGEGQPATDAPQPMMRSAIAQDPGQANMPGQPVATFSTAPNGQTPAVGGEPAQFAMQMPGEIPLNEIAPGEYAAQLPRAAKGPGEWGDPHIQMGRERVILSDREPMRGFGEHARMKGLKGDGPVKPEGPDGMPGQPGAMGEDGIAGQGMEGELGVLGEAGAFDEALMAGRGEIKEKGKKKKSDKDEALRDHILKNLDKKDDEEVKAEDLAKLQAGALQQPTFQMKPPEVQAVERPRPVYDAQAIRGIVQEVRMVASPGDKSRIEIQLTSKTLEGLNIKIERNDEGRLAIQFNTMNNDVAQLLERNMMNLQQSLAANGLRVANMQVVNPVISTQPMFQQTFTQSSSRENNSGDREGGGQGRGGEGGGQDQGGGSQGGGGGQQGRRGRR